MIEVEVDTRWLTEMFFSPKHENIGPTYCSPLGIINKTIQSFRGR